MEQKISAFFLVFVLLFSVTNLQTFSVTQLDSDLYHSNELSLGIMGVAFADDDDDDEDDDDKEKKEKKEKKGKKQEIKVELEDGKAEIEIKVNDIETELELESTDLDEILSTIQTITGLSESEIKDIWEVKIESDDDEEDDDDHGKKEKITICHIPPGNPNNAHEINVSGNAKNAHMAHGDTLGECPDNDDNPDDDQDILSTITLTKEVTNDNQGTAGPDDFMISVNGTVVLSGSTTEVEPDVLFAISETLADGYEFVEITGDAECPINLDEETISLAPGQDISCTIHNNDVGQALDASTQTSESALEGNTDSDDISQLIEDNQQLREDLQRQAEQIEELNEQIDYLSEIIQSIQGFFGNLFG